MPTSQRARPKDRKEAIALVAAELFCARGYHNVGIEDIAQEVGITGPAIYRHFPNKQAVLAAAVEELVTRFAECVAAGAGAATPGERLHAALRALVRYTLDRRGVARLYQWEARHLDPGLQAEPAASFDRSVRALRELLLGVRPELGRRDAALLTSAALSVVASPATHRASLPRAKAEQTVLSCVAAVLAADLPAPDGPPGTRSEGFGRSEGSGRSEDSGRFALLPRRERLLAEAIRLFDERGYHQVSIADIGQAAGINASSVYTHFTGKAELLAAAYYRATSRLEHLTAAALSGAGTPAEALSRLIDTYVAYTFDQADLTAVYLTEGENLPPADLRRLRAAQRRHVDTWTGLLAELRPGEEPARVRFRAHAALNIVADLARSAGPSASESRTAALLRQVLVTDRDACLDPGAAPPDPGSASPDPGSASPNAAAAPSDLRGGTKAGDGP